MSFKRDGDDFDVLNMLKHRRVSTLLGEHIPEDEAKLLSNGRLTCTVCNHHPIFDTVAMLGRHRAGKKHILELSRYLKRKELGELESLKREQEKLAKTEALGALRLGLGVPAGGGSRGVLEGFDRRKTLEVSIPQSTPSSTQPVLPVNPGKSHVRRYLKTLHRKRSLGSVIEKKRMSYGGETKLDRKDDCVALPDPPVPPDSQVAAPSSTPQPPPHLLIPPASGLPHLDTSNKGTATANYEFSLNLSGWIKDKHGEWIKDPNAEFDSD